MYVPPKRLLKFNRLLGFISQKIELFNILYMSLFFFPIFIYFPKIWSCRFFDSPPPHRRLLCPMPPPKLGVEQTTSARFRFVIFDFLVNLVLPDLNKRLPITVCSFDIFQNSDFLKAEHLKIYFLI